MRLFKQELAQNGYAFRARYLPKTSIIDIANDLGRWLIPWPGGLVQELVPRRTASPNTYGGIYGVSQFPFHSDLAHWRLPPRYLLLRCLVGHPEVATQLVDSQTIVGELSVDLLKRAVFRPRRPRGGTLELCRLLQQMNEEHCFRWDEVFIQPASRVGEVAAAQIKEHLSACKAEAVALVNEGDTLLIDNWRMLHARSPVRDVGMTRRVQRIYLETVQ
jgi:L-asparagine oxygenase